MAGAAAALLSIVLSLVVASVASSDVFLPDFLIWPITVGPLPVGIALVMGTPPPARYAFGCGVLLGWPISIIVSSGLCLGGVLTPFRIAG